MKLTRKKIWGLSAAVAALVVVVILVWSLAGSSTGTITNPPAAKPAAPITYINKSGTYIYFKYPSNFGVAAADKPTGSELEVFSFIKRPTPFYFLNIVVSKLPSGNLADDGSYNSRLSQPERYTKSAIVINGQLVNIFSDNTSVYSKAAFLAHEKNDASVALSADSPDPGLDQILTKVLQSLGWH